MDSSNPQALLHSSSVTGVGASNVGVGDEKVSEIVGWKGIDVSVGASGGEVLTSVVGADLHPATNISTSANPVDCFILELSIISLLQCSFTS